MTLERFVSFVSLTFDSSHIYPFLSYQFLLAYAVSLCLHSFLHSIVSLQMKENSHR